MRLPFALFLCTFLFLTLADSHSTRLLTSDSSLASSHRLLSTTKRKTTSEKRASRSSSASSSSTTAKKSKTKPSTSESTSRSTNKLLHRYAEGVQASPKSPETAKKLAREAYLSSKSSKSSSNTKTLPSSMKSSSKTRKTTSSKSTSSSGSKATTTTMKKRKKVTAPVVVETPAPETAAPETAAPETAAPDTAAPETVAPVTKKRRRKKSSSRLVASSEAPKESSEAPESPVLNAWESSSHQTKPNAWASAPVVDNPEPPVVPKSGALAWGSAPQSEPVVAEEALPSGASAWGNAAPANPNSWSLVTPQESVKDVEVTGSPEPVDTEGPEEVEEEFPVDEAEAMEVKGELPQQAADAWGNSIVSPTPVEDVEEGVEDEAYAAETEYEEEAAGEEEATAAAVEEDNGEMQIPAIPQPPAIPTQTLETAEVIEYEEDGDEIEGVPEYEEGDAEAQIPAVEGGTAEEYLEGTEYEVEYEEETVEDDEIAEADVAFPHEGVTVQGENFYDQLNHAKSPQAGGNNLQPMNVGQMTYGQYTQQQQAQVPGGVQPPPVPQMGQVGQYDPSRQFEQPPRVVIPEEPAFKYQPAGPVDVVPDYGEDTDEETAGLADDDANETPKDLYNEMPYDQDEEQPEDYQNGAAPGQGDDEYGQDDEDYGQDGQQYFPQDQQQGVQMPLQNWVDNEPNTERDYDDVEPEKRIDSPADMLGFNAFETNTNLLPTLTLKELTRVDESGKVLTTLEIPEASMYNKLMIRWQIVGDPTTTQTKHVTAAERVTLTLVPGPSQYRIEVCGVMVGETCATQVRPETTRQLDRRDSDGDMAWTKFTVTIRQAKLRSLTKQNQDMNAIYKLDDMLGSEYECDDAPSTGMDAQGEKTVTFWCLFSLKRPSAQEYQTKSELGRQKFYNQFHASDVAVSQYFNASINPYSSTSGGSTPWLNYFLGLGIIGGIGYYVYSTQIQKPEKWSSIRQYDDEDIEETFSEEEKDNPAKEFLKEVLIELGFPQYSLEQYMKILQDHWITSMDQLEQMSSKDLKNLGFNDALVEELEKRLSKSNTPKRSGSMQLSKSKSSTPTNYSGGKAATKALGGRKPKAKSMLASQPDDEEDEEDDWGNFDFPDDSS